MTRSNRRLTAALMLLPLSLSLSLVAACGEGDPPSPRERSGDVRTDRPGEDGCGEGRGYIAELDRCVACDDHWDPNPYDACGGAYVELLPARGCPDSGTAFWRCTRCERLGPVVPPSETGRVGEPYEASLALTREPRYTGGIPVTVRWEIRGELPDGITLDPETGALSGTPTEAGRFELEAEALFDPSPEQETCVARFTLVVDPA